MAEHPAIFRDFGILPDQLLPPQPTVRAFLSPWRIAVQYATAGVVLAFGIAVAVFIAWQPTPLNWFGSVATFAAFFTFIYVGTRYSFGSIELVGDVLKAHHLYTGGMIERQVKDIDCLITLFQGGQGLAKAINERLWGRIKGIEVRFRDRRTPLRICRTDPAMTGAQELVEAILYRMSQIAELESEIVDRRDQPMVQNIHWRGATYHGRQGPSWQVLACLTMAMPLMFGSLLCILGRQDHELLEVYSRPPHEMTLFDLIEQGPGDNRHVTITDFEPGGYYRDHSQIWIAVFPVAGPKSEIKAVVYSKAIANENALQQFLQPGKITVACSTKKRVFWGTAVKPALAKHSANRPLKAAWEMRELHHPPSRESVRAQFLGSYACFAIVLLFAAVILGSELVAKIRHG